MLDERLVDRWLSRGQRFFRSVTRNSVVRGTLAARGLTKQELVMGWDLYSRVLGIDAKEEEPAPTPSDAASAMSKLDSWDAPNFKASEAVLKHRTPKAAAFLHKDLSAASGPEAVVAVGQFLN